MVISARVVRSSLLVGTSTPTSALQMNSTPGAHLVDAAARWPFELEIGNAVEQQAAGFVRPFIDDTWWCGRFSCWAAARLGGAGRSRALAGPVLRRLRTIQPAPAAIRNLAPLISMVTAGSLMPRTQAVSQAPGRRAREFREVVRGMEDKQGFFQSSSFMSSLKSGIWLPSGGRCGKTDRSSCSGTPVP